MSYNFKIIAFGSSAGGLKPLKKIFSLLPEDLNACLVVVPHLYPLQKSNMDRILQRVVPMPVVRVESGCVLSPGKVYVMPEGKLMTLRNRALMLRDRQPEEKINRAIDTFFTSLGEDAGKQAIGVVLSGAAGYDGINGAKKIEDKGGIVIVQDPYTAEFPSMPQSLIAFDHPDYVLTPEDIAEKITEMLKAKEQEK
jgi:two-component system, chemotaxis family, protein-glutamate methylesterase/glutaminase